MNAQRTIRLHSEQHRSAPVLFDQDSFLFGDGATADIADASGISLSTMGSGVELSQCDDLFEPTATHVATVQESPLYQPFVTLVREHVPDNSAVLAQVTSQWHRVIELEDIISTTISSERPGDYHTKVSMFTPLRRPSESLIVSAVVDGGHSCRIQRLKESSQCPL